MDFFEFAERWAMTYKPLSHDPAQDGGRGRRYFMHDNQADMKGIVDSLTQANKTDRFMSVITGHQGELAALSEKASAPNFIVWDRFLLFWARQHSNVVRGTNVLDEREALIAKQAAVKMAEDFLTFLQKMTDPRRGDLKSMAGWEQDEVRLLTLPGHYNYWWVCVLSFKQIVSRDLCPAPNDYNLEQLYEMFPQAKTFIK